MSYRFVRAFNEIYGPAVFALFVLAFFTAFVMMVYPIASLLILIASVYAVVLFWAFGRLMRALERALARRGLTRGACPVCGGALEVFDIEGAPPERVHDCSRCRRAFRWNGEPWTAPDSPAKRVGPAFT